MAKKMKWWQKSALLLTGIGALNWGLNEIGFNVVDALIGSWSAMLASIVYILVGVSGLYTLIWYFNKKY